MRGPSTVQLRLFGQFRLVIDGRVPARLPSARQQELIALVVLQGRDGPVARQRIAAAIWPDSTDVQALTNLRRELHHLREDWPRLEAAIKSASRTLAWRPDAAVAVDVIDFEAAAGRGLDGDVAALQPAATLYSGDLLPGCTAEWIEPERERLRNRARQVLARLVAHLETIRAYGDAIEAAQQLIRLDPVDEQTWCALMRCHARRGERATALHAFQQCAAVLKKELGIQPSAATRLTYREILDLDADAPSIPAPPRTAVYPLVGRHAEWSALLTAWRGAATGQTRLVVIRGEAGIGKTRLAEELTDWCRVNGVAAVTARCYAGEGHLAYAPIAAWLKSNALQPAVAQLDPAYMTDVARLRPELLGARPEVPAPGRHLESWEHLRFFEALAQAFRRATPLVLVLDDLQWADADTIEWLHFFLRSAAGDARALIVATLRAEEEQDNRPLGPVLRQLERDDLLTVISLGPLDRTATAQLAGEVVGQALDEGSLAQAFRETEGHPLFIVERGRMALADQSGTADTATAPRVQSIVAARLALLSDDARAAAEVAAAVGRDFEFDILIHASDLEEDALVRALDELWRRQVVRVQSDQRWDFTHDRIREVAYSNIGPARRRLVHRRIAQAMEILFAARLDDVSAAIAAHLERGGQPARAIPFLERAAAVAGRLSANEEAIRCLTHAVSMIELLPPGRDRNLRELEVRSALSVALNSGRGYAAPDVQDNLNRVLGLLLADGNSEIPVKWLWVAFTVNFMLGDLTATRAGAEQALALSAADPSCRCEAYHAMGATLLSMGELVAARDHFDVALAAYDERQPQRSALGSDLGVFTKAWSSHALWLLGDEQAAVARAQDAIALARRLGHPYSETLALAYAALLDQLRLDVDGVVARARTVVALCDRYGFGYYGDWAQVLLGWTRARDNAAEGIAIIERALERLDRVRAQARRPYYLSLLADAYDRLGDRTRAATILDEAIAMASARADLWWLPALYLQRSDYEPRPGRDETIERALALARAQNSRSLERRITAASAPRAV